MSRVPRVVPEGGAAGAAFVVTRLLQVGDLFERLPKVVQLIASPFLKRPVACRYLGTFRGSLTRPDGTTGSFLLDGMGEYVIAK